jgi:hypothetical protein
VSGYAPRARQASVHPRLQLGASARPLNFTVRRCRVPKFTPKRMRLLCAAVVALSTVAFPWIHGYGTILFQLVVLVPRGIVAAIISGRYADLHHNPVWALALCLNVLLFLIPAGLFYLTTWRRWPGAFGAGVMVCASSISAVSSFFSQRRTAHDSSAHLAGTA